MTKKNILFVTGTRADFGKIKSLITVCEDSEVVEPFVFVTGMHLNETYGYTIEEVRTAGYKNIIEFRNHTDSQHMDRTVARTIDGLSSFLAEQKIDLIIVHGDRVEALAGAIVGSLNNILVAHIEGGEVSGTIDEIIRHSVSKLSHVHLVANDDAKRRLIQLGEEERSIFVIGSPDLDLMFSNELPSLSSVKEHYDIDFDDYAIAMFHPVTTEVAHIEMQAKEFVEALIASDRRYIVIFPNNDLGSEEILRAYERFNGLKNFRVFPSLRFESFLVLLKNAAFMIGNSSAAMREAPYYGVPSVNIGTRQNNRVSHSSIFNVQNKSDEILRGIGSAQCWSRSENVDFAAFGRGKSDKQFAELLRSGAFWMVSTQKYFQDL